MHGIAWSPDGKTLASAAEDEALRLWDVASGQPLRKLRWHPGWVREISWTEDGNTLAAGTAYGMILRWDLVDGEMHETPVGAPGGIIGVAWSPNGQALAWGTADGGLYVWDAAETLALKKALMAQDRAFIDARLARYPYRLEGIELVEHQPRRLWITEPPAPRWPEHHPLHWRERAESGDVDAMEQLGLICNRGRDFRRAHRWFSRAVAAGTGPRLEGLVADTAKQLGALLQEQAWAAAEDGRIDAAFFGP